MAEEDISNWLIQNPQRLNIANIGLHFTRGIVTEDELKSKSQSLDLWEGTIISSFQYEESDVSVQVWCHPEDPMVAIQIKSDLITSGDLGVFFDFPSSDLNKFDAPNVGVWNNTSNNTVSLHSTDNTAFIKHILDSNINRLGAKWSTKGKMSGLLPGTNKYVLTPSGSDTLELVVVFPQDNIADYKFSTYEAVVAASKQWWKSYWTTGAFIDLSATNVSSAKELQRRIILSQYLVAVNEASDNPPQGKFRSDQMVCFIVNLEYLLNLFFRIRCVSSPRTECMTPSHKLS